MTSYVLDGIEVVKTGREAVRELKAAKGSRLLVLVEITPLDKDVGEWKKWIDPSLLFTVRDK